MEPPMTPYRFRSHCDGTQCFSGFGDDSVSAIEGSCGKRHHHVHHHHDHHQHNQISKSFLDEDFLAAKTPSLKISGEETAVTTERRHRSSRRTVSQQDDLLDPQRRKSKALDDLQHGMQPKLPLQRLDDPRRTDYTYAYSKSYRSPSPSKWENPRMSRRMLHGFTDYHSSSSSSAGASDSSSSVAEFASRISKAILDPSLRNADYLKNKVVSACEHMYSRSSTTSKVVTNTGDVTFMNSTDLPASSVISKDRSDSRNSRRSSRILKHETSKTTRQLEDSSDINEDENWNSRTSANYKARRQSWITWLISSTISIFIATVTLIFYSISTPIVTATSIVCGIPIAISYGAKSAIEKVKNFLISTGSASIQFFWQLITTVFNCIRNVATFIIGSVAAIGPIACRAISSGVLWIMKTIRNGLSSGWNVLSSVYNWFVHVFTAPSAPVYNVNGGILNGTVVHANNSEENNNGIRLRSILRRKVTEETISRSREIEGERRRKRNGFCCCWLCPLLLLLPLLFLAACNLETCEKMKNVIFPIPFLLMNKTREAFQAIPSFIPQPAAPVFTNVTETRIVHDNEEMKRLEGIIAEMRNEIALLKKSCCKEIDLSPYALRSDLEKMVTLHQQEIENIKSEFTKLYTAFKQLKQSGESDLTTYIDKLKALNAKYDALLESFSVLESKQKENLDGIGLELTRFTGIQSKLSVAEAELFALKQKQEEIALTVAKSSSQPPVVIEKASTVKDFGPEIEALVVDIRRQAEEVRILSQKLTTLEFVMKETKTSVNIEGGLKVAEVDQMISAAILKYDADKTGLADHALESAGGSVISVRCSETYEHRTRRESIFGIPLWYKSYSPRTVIQPGAIPGECWAFKGGEGYLVIQLSGWIDVMAVSYEHIQKSMSPDGHIDSAPKEIEIRGLQHENDSEGKFLAKFVYDQNGPPVQYFPVQAKDVGAVPMIQFHFLTNHGHPVYTCLYRIRVHGTRVQPAYGNQV